MSGRSSVPRLPLSPASPPESGLKSQSEDHVAIITPQTPPLTDQMSVATKRYVPFSHDGRHTNEMASRSPDSYVNQSQRPSISNTNPPPPNSLKRALPEDDSQSPASKRQRMDDRGNVMETEPSIAATNHDRQHESQPKQEACAGVSFDEQLDVQTVSQTDKAKLDSTFKDVGPALRIGKTTRKRAAVDLNDHLLGKYGLHELLSSVARIDPATGEKANKLRKSYEGQIKLAALSGRNRPHKEPREDDERSRLNKMSTISEAEFRETQVKSRPGDIDSLRDIMRSALQLNSGTMNKTMTAEWDDILGHEVKKSVPQQQLPISKAPTPKIPNGAQHQQQMSDKVKTRGKKRVYTDAGFEGYQGYADGLSDPDIASDGDKDYLDRGKKRRKE